MTRQVKWHFPLAANLLLVRRDKKTVGELDIESLGSFMFLHCIGFHSPLAKTLARTRFTSSFK